MSSVTAERQAEFREALNDSPIFILWNMFLHQAFGWPLYLIKNASGQLHYPADTNRESSCRTRPNDRLQPGSGHLQVKPQVADHHVGRGRRHHLCSAGLLGIQEEFLRGRCDLRHPIPLREPVSDPVRPLHLLNNRSWLVLITFLQHTDPVIREASLADPAH